MEDSSKQAVPLTRYAWLSIAAAVVTIALKVSAYFHLYIQPERLSPASRPN